jgi:shikimate kinase
MHYFLIGLPGSGKSTLGRQLAGALAIEILDTDKLIQKAEGLSIEEIFEQKGEAYFRLKEHELLTALGTEKPSVISLGGGTPCFHNNMALVKQYGKSIFLDVSPAALCKRLLADKTDHRPMLKGKNDEQVLEFLKTKRDERLPFYKQADVVLQNDFIQIEDILKALV